MKNKSLEKIQNKFKSINFEDIEDIFVVPVGEICEKLGLKVHFKKLEKGLSGYFDPENKKIIVNDDYPATRNLFTIAHEIGHYILHNGIQHRFDNNNNYIPEILKKEKDANNFAAELLMPEYKFQEVFKELRGNIKKIAERFGVSINAAEVRGICLGLIDNI